MDKVADKVADMVAEMVADMEVDKMADKVADMVADNKKEFTSILTWKSKLVREKVNWAKTFSPQSLPGLRIFYALWVYYEYSKVQ